MLSEWETLKNLIDLGEIRRQWGFSRVLNVPGWVGAVEQLCEWERAE